MRRCVASAEAAKPPLHPLQRLMNQSLLGWLPDTSKHWLQ
jgi:hypothetical protein